MTSEDPSAGTVAPPVVTPNPIFKILLVAFPLGIGILGIASIFIYYGKRSIDAERAAAGIDRRLQAALRVPASQESFEGYRRILEDVLGLPTTGDPDALRKTANYIESSLGQSNLGYKTRRADPAGQPPVVEAVVEGGLPATVIAADYTRPGAAAALLTLAADLAGQPLRGKTVFTATTDPPGGSVVLDGAAPLESVRAAAERVR